MSLENLVSNSNSAATPTSRRAWPAWILPLTLLLSFGAFFLLLFGEKLMPAREVQTLPVVTIRLDSTSESQAIQASKQLLFQASGWLEPEPYPILVTALVNGIVAEIHVLEGEPVKKGQLLATLIDDSARLDLEQAQAALQTYRARIAAHCSQVPELHAELVAARNKILAAKATLLEAKDDYERLKSLPEGATPKQQLFASSLKLQRLEALMAEAESEVPRIEAKLATIDYQRIMMGQEYLELEAAEKMAQLALDRHRILSPIDGKVLRLFVSPGQKRMLEMDDPQSATIVSLYKPGELQARIDVPLNEAAGLQIGQEVELVTDLLPDMTFLGQVTRITGEADLQRNTLQAKVHLTNPDEKLRPEMLMRAKFFSVPTATQETTNKPTAAARFTLLAPLQALIMEQDKTAQAWLATPEGRAELRQMTLGKLEREGHREVITGLRSGEKLILPPHNELKPGIRVRNTQP